MNSKLCASLLLIGLLMGCAHGRDARRTIASADDATPMGGTLRMEWDGSAFYSKADYRVFAKCAEYADGVCSIITVMADSLDNPTEHRRILGNVDMIDLARANGLVYANHKHSVKEGNYLHVSDEIPVNNVGVLAAAAVIDGIRSPFVLISELVKKPFVNKQRKQIFQKRMELIQHLVDPSQLNVEFDARQKSSDKDGYINFVQLREYLNELSQQSNSNAQ